MIVQQYVQMLGKKSAIRELFDYGAQRAKEIGYENVFDYSLGNPSVPVPKAFNQALADLALSGNDLAVHGYSPSLGILPDESTVHPVNLLISLVLVCLGVFLLNYVHNPKQNDEIAEPSTPTEGDKEA